MQVQTEFDLLGLFQGIGLPQAVEPGHRPDAQHDLAVSPADPGLLADHDDTAGEIVPPRPGSTKSATILAVGRRHGSHRGAGGRLRAG